jgi:hypothetical protein
VKTDDPNPFNFQPTVLAKSPVTKSVGFCSLVPGKNHPANYHHRTLVSDVVTNINTVVYRTRFSLNRRHEHP